MYYNGDMGFTMLITHLVPGMQPLNNLKPRKPALDGNFQVASFFFQVPGYPTHPTPKGLASMWKKPALFSRGFTQTQPGHVRSVWRSSGSSCRARRFHQR